eukprot:8221809-Alexandrium_andersonii.AAC.1
MSASLVGSEMCIRDSLYQARPPFAARAAHRAPGPQGLHPVVRQVEASQPRGGHAPDRVLRASAGAAHLSSARALRGYFVELAISR